MDIQQRRPQRGGEKPFDQKFLLIALLAFTAFMMLNRGNAPVAEPESDLPAAQLDDGDAPREDAEPEPLAQLAELDLDDEELAEEERIALGSVDPEGAYRMLLTVNNVGGGVERVELSSEDYRDLEDRSGYLGRLALSDASAGGAVVNVVGPGTPAAEAGLQVGDIVTAANTLVEKQEETVEITTAADLLRVLDASKPGRDLVLTTVRDETSVTLTAKLRRQPLDLMRPELENVLLHTPEPPADFKSVQSFVVKLASVAGRRADDPAVADANRRLVEEAWTIDERDAGSVVLRKRLADLGLEFVKRYTLVETPEAERDNNAHPTYHFDLSVELRNLNEQPQVVSYELTGPNGLPIEGYWYANKIGRGDGSFFGDWGSFGLRDVIVRFAGDRLTQFAASSVMKDKVRPMGGGQPLAFAGVDSQYFASIIIPQKESLTEVRTAEVRAELATPKLVERAQDRWQNSSCVLQRKAITLAASGSDDASVTDGYQIFAGPKLPALLEAYTSNEDAAHGLGDILYYGWFGFAAKPMLWLLHTFNGIVGNYGIAIVLLTICVRGAMFPISRKTAMNMVKMQEIKPEMDAIVARYGDDMQKRAAAQQELFRKHKYNPAAGCLPLFLQLPIFMGLYRALAVDVELRQQPLITESIRFCSNLASPDMFVDWSAYTPLWMDNGEGILGLGPYFNLLPILSCTLMLIQQKLFMPEATNDQARLQQSMMKYMMVFMGFIFFKMPSGLCIYFVASTLWGITERKMLPRPTPPAAGATAVSATPPKPAPSASEVTQAKKKLANKKKSKNKGKKR